MHYYQSANVETCKQACETAWEAFGVWKQQTAVAKRDLLWKVADIFEQKRDELIRVQRLETSCDEAWAVNNVVTTVKYIREAATCVTQIKGGCLRRTGAEGIIREQKADIRKARSLQARIQISWPSSSRSPWAQS